MRRPVPDASGRAALVQTLRHLLDDLVREGLEVARIARRDDAVVGHHLRILPLRAGIDAVGLDGLVGGGLAALDEAGLDQQPWRVAHGGDQLLLLVEGLDEVERLRVDAQEIGVDLPARQHDGVVLVGLDLVELAVDLHGPAPVLHVPALDLAFFRRHHMHGRARSLEAVARHLELRLLEAVGGENADFFAGDFHAWTPRNEAGPMPHVGNPQAGRDVPARHGPELRLKTMNPGELASIPVVDIRDGGPLRLAREACVPARALCDDCLAWFPRATHPAVPLLDAIARRWLRRSCSPYVAEVAAIAA